ncbi:MAG: phenylalanine--tRNA ligase subunit beta [Desulfurococcales archaeon]|nr:phenylalanine--tRNA ligase subunit beta [Desulfurococcales archaeon]
MPVIRLSLEKLTGLTGLTSHELKDTLFRLKCESEEVEPGILEVEVNPDRPDMLITEGLVRAVNGLTGEETGYPGYPVVGTDYTVELGNLGARKYIAVGVVENVNVDEEYLEELIQFQEKLHVTFGRKRRKAAIGFHDLSKLPCNRLEYTYIDPSKTRFRPLHWDREMTGLEVLRETEQGKLYGNINLEQGQHPFLLACGEVIAMPPVINSDITRVEPGTHSLLIDVTGPDKWTVMKLLDIITVNLADREGAKIGRVKVLSRGKETVTPLLEEEKVELNPDYTQRILGLEIPVQEQAEILERMRYNAVASESKLTVTVPPYRVDILGEIDLVEDIAIAYGYDNIPLKTTWTVMRGELSDRTVFAREISDILIGGGFVEVMQLALVGPTILAGKWDPGTLVEIGNPVMAEYSILRPSLIPGLIQVARANISASKPIKAFEIGPVVYKDNVVVKESWRLGLLYMDDEASYEQLQAVVYKVLRLLGTEPGAAESRHPYLIEGRTGRIYANNVEIGFLGEARPDVLLEFGVEYPTVLAEVDLDKLMEVAGWIGS